MAVLACRSCGSDKVTRHCLPGTSSTCDLVRCLACKSFGNATRWHNPNEEG